MSSKMFNTLEEAEMAFRLLEQERDRLVAFIQQVANVLTDDDEVIDFITNNAEDVLEDENGEDKYPRIPYF